MDKSIDHTSHIPIHTCSHIHVHVHYTHMLTHMLTHTHTLTCNLYAFLDGISLQSHRNPLIKWAVLSSGSEQTCLLAM